MMPSTISAKRQTPPSRGNKSPHLDGPINSQTTGGEEVIPEVLTSVVSVEAPRITRGNRKKDLQSNQIPCESLKQYFLM